MKNLMGNAFKSITDIKKAMTIDEARTSFVEIVASAAGITKTRSKS